MIYTEDRVQRLFSLVKHCTKPMQYQGVKCLEHSIDGAIVNFYLFVLHVCFTFKTKHCSSLEVRNFVKHG